MRPFSRVLMFIAALSSLPYSQAHAKPETLAALFQSTPVVKSKKKMKRAPLLPIPEEYRIYFHSKSVLAKPVDLIQLEATEREVLLSKLRAQTRTLEKDLEEIFSALEIKRGSRLMMKKSWAQGIDSYQRGLGGLPPFKWIYYWDENDSKLLSADCSRKLKNPDDTCLTLAKRVVDAFPKAALETKPLRDLNFSVTLTPQPDNGADRLSQTYSEKAEKDEEDFQELLDAFLKRKDIDILKLAKEFISNYPKSVLRFRATFLMGESLNRTGGKKEAQPLYQSLMDQVPLSFYAIVASERLGVNLRDSVQKEPIQIDTDLLNPNAFEKKNLERAKILFSHRNYDEVGIELDTLVRTRNYSTDFLLYLMRFAYDANQNLSSFKFINELIQRKYDHLLNDDLISIVFPERFLPEIEEAATLIHVDPLWVVSLMKQESGFKLPILSSSGAIGLMQLMPFTAIDTQNDLKLRSLKEAKVNIAVGTKYLGSLIEKYEGNIPFALSAYNAGPNRVAKWRKELKPGAEMIDYIESIPYKETREYVMAILRNRYWYQYRKGVPNQSVFEAWESPASSAVLETGTGHQ